MLDLLDFMLDFAVLYSLKCESLPESFQTKWTENQPRGLKSQLCC